MEEFRFSITEEMEEERIDKCISMLIDSLSRSYIQKLIREEAVTVNGRPVKGSYRVKTDDEVAFCLPKAVEPSIEAEDIPLDILYEDRDIIVVNKPKGMVVHPAAGHYSGTLVNALMYHCGSELSGINGCMRPGIVHRIDRDTTGSLIVCKNDAAHRAIAAQLKEHSIHRKYLAVCHGVIKEEEGCIDKPVGRHPADRKKMAVTPRGKRAVTHYRVLERFGKFTYAQFRLWSVCWKQEGPTRYACIWPRWGIPFWAMRCIPRSPLPTGWRDRCCTRGRWDFGIPPQESTWKSKRLCRSI